MTFAASADGHRLRLGMLPALRRGSLYTSLKACSAATIIRFQREGDAPVSATTPGAQVDGSGALARLTVPSPVGDIELVLTDPMPPAEQITTPGRFAWELRAPAGRLAAGLFNVVPRSGGRLAVAIDVTHGWEGSHGLPQMDAFTRLIPVFRWATNYSWAGELRHDMPTPTLTGNWVNARFAGR